MSKDEYGDPTNPNRFKLDAIDTDGDGKGTSIKAHDYRIAFLCHQCHHMIDNDKSLDKHDRIAAWEEAHRKTIGWLFTNNHLEVK